MVLLCFMLILRNSGTIMRIQEKVNGMLINYLDLTKFMYKDEGYK